MYFARHGFKLSSGAPQAATPDLRFFDSVRAPASPAARQRGPRFVGPRFVDEFLEKAADANAASALISYPYQAERRASHRSRSVRSGHLTPGLW